jgi:predicted transcriptional regulator
MTQADVTKVANVDVNYIERIERGEVNPSYEKLQSIKRY